MVRGGRVRGYSPRPQVRPEEPAFCVFLSSWATAVLITKHGWGSMLMSVREGKSVLTPGWPGTVSKLSCGTRAVSEPQPQNSSHDPAQKQEPLLLTSDQMKPKRHPSHKGTDTLSWLVWVTLHVHLLCLLGTSSPEQSPASQAQPPDTRQP